MIRTLGIAGIALLAAGSLAAPARPSDPVRVGRVESWSVRSPSLAGNLLGDPAKRQVLVYLPPSYDASAARRYPVLVLLHSFGVGPESWRGENGYEGMDLAALLDRRIADGSAPEMIVAMPDARTRYGGSWYAVSAAIGDWERFVAVELVADLDARLRTIRRRGARAIAGQSMGAYGALRIASAHPEVFATVVAISAPHLANPNPLGDFALEAALAVESPDAVLAGSPLPAVIWSKAAAFSADPGAPPFFARLPAVLDGEGLREVPQVRVLWERSTMTGLLEEPARAAALSAIDVRLDVGRDDPLRRETAILSDALVERGIEHEVVEFPGGHVAGVRDHLANSVLPYLALRLAGTEEPTDPAR